MSKKNKKMLCFSLLCTLLFVTTCICGCSKKEEASQTPHIVLNEVAHSIFYAPMYVAFEEGYFAEEGLEVDLVTGYGADKTMAALVSGDADIGFMGAECTIYSYAQGMENPAINFAQLTQRAGNFLVSREPMDSFSWNMLKGKTVLGGRAGGMPEMVFEYILAKNGLSKSDMNIDQSIDFGSTAAAFSGGQGDFTIEFEPHATALEEKGDGFVVASLGEASGYVPYTSFSARKDYIEAHPEIIQAFTAALQKGMLFCSTHTATEIAQVIAPQFSETEISTITKIISRYSDQDTWKTDLVFTKEAFDLLQNILLDAEQLDKPVAYEEIVNTTFAESVK